MPIAVRHVESIIRMSEARAAMRLSEHVSSEDVDAVSLSCSRLSSGRRSSPCKNLCRRSSQVHALPPRLRPAPPGNSQGSGEEMNYWESVGGGAGGGAGSGPGLANESQGATTTVRCESWRIRRPSTASWTSARSTPVRRSRPRDSRTMPNETSSALRRVIANGNVGRRETRVASLASTEA